MVWIRPSVVVLMIVIQTCSAGRLERMERRLEMKLKAFQDLVELRLDATDGDFGTLADRVSKLEAIVSTSENDISEKRSNGSRNEHTKAYTKPEVNHIQNTLTMYKRSFEKQKQEMNDVKMVFKDALSVFLNNASLTVSTLFDAVNKHVNNSADDISATLKNVSDTVVKSGSHLRSDIFTYLGNLSSEVKTELALHVEGATDDSNKTLIALNSQVRDHIANETESLEVFKTKILQDVNEARALVQNETTELEKKVEELIGRAKEVVGIIDEQRSTIEDGIMVTIRALHSSWSDWSAWSDCSRSSDMGSRSRHRSCDVPPPITDGICIGNDTDTEECVINELCPYDCSDVLKRGMSRGSGVYNITPWNTHKKVEVYCDMDTEGGGWTVFQRRWDGSVAFNRSFVDYERGFGSMDGEFWTGLDILHSMTSRGNMTLRLDMSLLDGTTAFDEYSAFYISPPDRYSFSVDKRINSGRMSDSYLLSDNNTAWSINHQPFSTYDRDMDNWSTDNCAQKFGGGWWYNDCMRKNLNGPYTSDYFYYSSFKKEIPLRLQTSTMMLRLSY